MPNKRSSRRKTQNFQCCFCTQRLWRLGSNKHHLYYNNAQEIRDRRGLSRKASRILATQGLYVDTTAWIEEFFCGHHGKMWLLVTKKPDDTYALEPAKGTDWSRTTKTIDPNTPNPSVSEYTLRLSRRADIRLAKYTL